MAGDVAARMPDFLKARDAVVWSRHYSHVRADECDCPMLDAVLQRVGARRMVVGHTIQPQGINVACEVRLSEHEHK